MIRRETFRLRDWGAGLAVGSALGLVILGIGSRAGMRFIALQSGQPGGFSPGGTMTVVFLGMVTGATMALIFLVVRFLLPSRPLLGATIFWAVCIGLTLRGLRPVSLLNASVFLPLVVVDGALLQLLLTRTISRRHTQ